MLNFTTPHFKFCQFLFTYVDLVLIVGWQKEDDWCHDREQGSRQDEEEGKQGGMVPDEEGDEDVGVMLVSIQVVVKLASHFIHIPLMVHLLNNQHIILYKEIIL